MSLRSKDVQPLARWAALFGLFLVTGLRGQPDLLDLSLEELLSVKVTGATLTDESVLSVPSAVSVFEREEMTALGTETLEELMNFVPGFQAFNMGESGHSSPFSSRGRKSGTTSREVLVLLDGMRLDTTIYGGTAFALPQLPLANIERAEFIRGPGSAIYGSNAFLGVVNLVSHRDLDRIDATLGAPHHVDAALLRHVQAGPVDGQIFLRFFEDVSQSMDVTNTLTGAPMETRREVHGHDLQGRFSWGDTSLQFVSANRRAPGFFVLGDTVEDFIGYLTTFHRVELEHRVDWGHGHTTTASVGYRRWNEEIRSELYPAGALVGHSEPSSTAAMRGEGHFREHEYSAQLVHDWNLNVRGHLLLGAEWRSANLDEAIGYTNFSLEGLLEGAFPIASGDDRSFALSQLLLVDRTVYGLFAQYQRHFWEDLEMTLGLRYDQYSEEGARTSPRLGLVYRWSSSLAFKVMYGEAFRAASFVEKYSINNPILVGNPNLKPETIRTIDLVMLWHSSRHMISAGFFHNQFSDGIVNGIADEARTFVNAGEGKNSGLELEYQASLGESWSLRLGITRIFQDIEETFREADVLGSVAINFHRGDWNLNLATLYQGERERADVSPGNRVTLPAVAEVNLNLRYQINDWTLRMQILNLFNRENATPPQSLSTRQNIPGRGRELRVGAEWAF